MVACLRLKAAIAPEATSVNARPMLKLNTSVAPRAKCFSCRQISSTVMDAGQGISPPVRPNITICPVVTF